MVSVGSEEQDRRCEDADGDDVDRTREDKEERGAARATIERGASAGGPRACRGAERGALSDALAAKVIPGWRAIATIQPEQLHPCGARGENAPMSTQATISTPHECAQI